MKKRTRIPIQILFALIGICLGLVLCLMIMRSTRLIYKKFAVEPMNLSPPGKFYNNKIDEQNRNFVFIGIMTANKFLKTRCKAIYDTWAKDFPGKIVFFTSEKSEWVEDIPMVRLPRVDDSYPPQKKVFMMLKYIHDNYLDRFEWFIRGDDDVFIRGERLETFLRSLNSSKPYLIGQAGFGNKEEIGSLSLSDSENFCVGGPGMIMSRETLRLFIPNMKSCLHNLLSTHEDVEIARCVSKYAKVNCTWAYEMQILFHHEYDSYDSYSKNLAIPDIINSISLHPLKKIENQYRVKKFFSQLKLQNLRQKELYLKRKIYANVQKRSNIYRNFHNSIKRNISIDKYLNERFLVSPSLKTVNVPRNRLSAINFDFMWNNMYSVRNAIPRKGLETFHRALMTDSIRILKETINKTFLHRKYEYQWKPSDHVYIRKHPLYGIDFILGQKNSNKNKSRLNNFHYYFRRTFNDLRFKEDTTYNSFFIASKEANNRSIKLLENIQSSPLNETINFIVPLAGRLPNFNRFMQCFEKVCLKNGEAVTLTIILFSNEKDQYEKRKIHEHISLLKKKYKNYLIRIIDMNMEFSRALACEVGAAQYSNSSLLLIIDIDIVFEKDFLFRIRTHTVMNRQVYFPIFFSQFNPAMRDIDRGVKHKIEPSEYFVIDDKRGYWRQYSFGMVSTYKIDFLKTGGFNTSIVGWGKEDIDIYEKFIASGTSVFRSIDPSFTHVYHDIICDESLDKEQRQMCLGTMYPTVASQSSLARHVYRKDLLTFDLMMRKMPIKSSFRKH